MTTAETGLPGSPNTSVVAAAAEPGRLARLERDPPEHLLDAELGQRRLDVVVRADRDAAGDDHHVRGLERGRDALLRGVVVVGQPPRRFGAWRPALAASPASIGALELWISPGPQRLARGPELVARAQHRDARAGGDGQLADAGGDGGAQLGRAEPRAGLEHGAAGAHVLAGPRMW